LSAFVQSRSADQAGLRAQVEAAVASEAGRLNLSGYPAHLLSWQSQLRFIAERAAQTRSSDAALLQYEIGWHLHAVADLKGAKGAYERALALSEMSLGPEHGKRRQMRQ
jgi:hypothetical protein